MFKIGGYSYAGSANHFLINDAFAGDVAEIKERENFNALIFGNRNLIFKTAAQALFAAHKTFLIAANRINATDIVSIR